ncbi:hypothetical protein G7Y89_g13496 [Cudoniella acicularis]|uniref:C2H2-type domain-containing protein n=1 Tax=Cudoniella acicularis TaxID=354080 RepID=A0A8H4VW05_9HELO|nr:hypothetical protein G7Y89_g13496 [Cudoniella acicularis]
MDDVCNRILLENFAVTLDDISDPEDAWKSVHRCLDELTHITGCKPSYQTCVGIDIGALNMNVAASGDSYPPSNDNSYQHYQEKRQQKGKEKEKSSRDGNESDLDNTASQIQDCGSTDGSKRSKVIGNFSCPFRKRNPLRFNVRDHHNCAITKFPDITLVKRHVLTYHKRKNLPTKTYLCSRCNTKFPSPQERDIHLRVPIDRICPMREPAEVAGDGDDDEIDPEDGITPVVGDRLRDRRINYQILQWGILWTTLFPLDLDIPSSEYKNVIEHHEIRRLFQDHSDSCRLMVQSKAKSMLSGMSQTSDVNYTQEMWDLFQSFLQYTFERCDQIVFTTVTKTSQKRKRHQEPQSIQPSPASNNSNNDRPTTRRRLMPYPSGNSNFIQSQQPSPSSTSTLPTSNAPGFSGTQTLASSTQVSFREVTPLTGLQDHELQTEALDTLQNGRCFICEEEPSVGKRRRVPVILNSSRRMAANGYRTPHLTRNEDGED